MTNTTNNTAATTATTTEVNKPVNIKINQTLLAVTALAGIISKELTLPELREEYLEELAASGMDATEQYKLITLFDEQVAICRGDADAEAITASDIVTPGEQVLHQIAIDSAIDQLTRTYLGGSGKVPVQETETLEENEWGSTAQNPIDGKMFIPGTGVVLSRDEALDVLQKARDRANADNGHTGIPAITAGIRAMTGLATYS